MAVKSKSNWRRSSVIALAMSALSIPSFAQAEPDQKRGWGERVAREDTARAERPERPARQAAPQAQAPQRQQQPQRTWSPPPQAQGAVHAAPQSRWNGGEDRRGGDNGQRRGWTNGTTEQRGVQQSRDEAQTRQTPSGATWRDRTARTDENERRVRNRDWQSRDGQSSTWQGRTAEAERVARPAGATTQTRTGTDWRSRVQRTDTNRTGDRDYWRNRDWSNHWDRSRHRNWSGWNNQWNWTWGHDYRHWNTHWRSSSRYDWYGWRNRYPSYFQVGFYTSPYRGYSYRRLSIGYFLDSLFFRDDYWIADPWYYRLPEAYGPYRWVRYYDDAVLVNIYSGEVADVIYDFFW